MPSASGSADEAWLDAVTAARLLAVDPAGLGGAALRGLGGPMREAWLTLLRASLPDEAPWRRVPLHITDDRLLGGLDLAATLRAGRPMVERGLLLDADGGMLLLAMAERLDPNVAARLAAVLDEGLVRLERDGFARSLPTRFAVVALDEGLEADERPPAALLDRLAFRIVLDGLRPVGAVPADLGGLADETIDARARLSAVRVGEDIVQALCGAALALGVASLRAPLLAVRVARAAAALGGAETASEEDAALAARLVLAPRATRLPTGPDQEQAEPEEEPDAPPPDPSQEDTQAELEELLVEAARAALPPNILAELLGDQRRSRGRAGGRSSALREGALRGRPAGSRRGAPGRGKRLNLVETLRAAAPWQPLRRRSGDRRRIHVRADDFRVTRYRERARTLTIFVVDASGSAAVARMAEAKGAVELLLADCYIRRDQVALVAFRGSEAQLLLPPTRSLARAKRSLAALPGGGGTPMAAGLEAGLQLALQGRRAGDTPVLIVMTDGRATIAHDGTPGRGPAEADALAAARRIRAAEVTALLIDTARRPHAQARQLAEEMGGRYLALPYADAGRLSTAVRSTAEGGAHA